MAIDALLQQLGAQFRRFDNSALVDDSEVRPLPDVCFVRTELLRADHGFRYIFAVVPIDSEIAISRVARILGGAELSLCDSSETEMYCGADSGRLLTPFGSLCGVLTIVDDAIARHAHMAFKDDLNHWIVMRYQDYAQIEHPLMGKFAIGHSHCAMSIKH